MGIAHSEAASRLCLQAWRKPLLLVPYLELREAGGISRLQNKSCLKELGNDVARATGEAMYRFVRDNLSRRLTINQSYMPYEFVAFKDSTIVRPQNIYAQSD